MLQQILRDMWVDPAILAELDETQKQTLFVKMREEQLRRWRDWDLKMDDQIDSNGGRSTATKTKSRGRHVTFRVGTDGEPWVWVMGERGCTDGDDDIDNTLSFDRINLRHESNSLILRDVTMKYQRPAKVAAKIALWEQKLHTPVVEAIAVDEIKPSALKIDTSDFNKTNEDDNNDNNEEAEAAEEEEEQEEEFNWAEQKRKAEHADITRRDIARRARESYRLSLDAGRGVAATSGRNSTIDEEPAVCQEDVVRWFWRDEQPHLNQLELAKYFHGTVSVAEVDEMLLGDEENGAFVVRLAESFYGYVISIRVDDEVRHLPIKVNEQKCRFSDATHDCLTDLVAFHLVVPVHCNGETIALGVGCAPPDDDPLRTLPPPPPPPLCQDESELN